MHSIRIKQWILRIVVLNLGVSLGACSSQQLYSAIQENQKFRCQNEKLHSAYQECMAHYQQRYSDYERNRSGH